MFGFETVDKVHGGDETSFGCRTANVQQVWVDIGWWGKGAENLTVEGYFCRKVRKMEIAYRFVRNSFEGKVYVISRHCENPSRGDVHKEKSPRSYKL